MAEEKKVEEQKFTPEVEKSLTEATTSDEIRDIVAGVPRDGATGRFVSPAATTTAKVEPKKEEPEPTVVKDTFLIGGKPIEFTGDSAEDLLKQVKVAQQTWEMAQPKPEVKKEEPKAALTPEELAALSLKASTGDLKAIEEYMLKSGVLDRYLESKGFKPDEYKEVLAERATEKTVKDWDGAVKEFLADSDWPGGTQNEKLLKYKLAELKDEKGQPLAYTPSKSSLQKAYDSLKEEGMIFARAEEDADKTTKAEPAKTAAATTTTPAATTTPAPKRPATGSTAFGTSQEQGVRKTAATTTKAPAITDDMTPQQIMDAFKATATASGQSPDDVLRGAYSGRA